MLLPLCQYTRGGRHQVGGNGDEDGVGGNTTVVSNFWQLETIDSWLGWRPAVTMKENPSMSYRIDLDSHYFFSSPLEIVILPVLLLYYFFKYLLSMFQCVDESCVNRND